MGGPPRDFENKADETTKSSKFPKITNTNGCFVSFVFFVVVCGCSLDNSVATPYRDRRRVVAQFTENRVRVLVWLLWFIDVWRIPARWVLGIYLVWDNLVPFIWSGPRSSVAHGAHIGGFVAGVMLAALWPSPGRRRMRTAPIEPARVQFARLVRNDERRAASELYAQMSLSERAELEDTDVLSLARGH